MNEQPKKETIQSLTLYKQLVEEYGEENLESISSNLIELWKEFQKHGNFYSNAISSSKKTILKHAEDSLVEIQQKKLFNLQCLWRAGEIELDIMTSHSFGYYHKLIFECPFIDPISYDELTAYKEFLLESQDFPGILLTAAKHEELVEAAINNSDVYPAWYRFYDKKFETGKLLHMTDIVSDKEAHYLRKHFVKTRQLNPDNAEGLKKLSVELSALHKAYDTGDFSNIITARKQQLLELANLINDHKFASYLKIVMEKEESLPLIYVEQAYLYLNSLFYDYPAVKKNYTNWQEGLYKTAWEHLKLQIIKNLDAVYEDYKAGKFDHYPEEVRKEAQDDLDFWQNAYIAGRDMAD